MTHRTERVFVTGGCPRVADPAATHRVAHPTDTRPVPPVDLADPRAPVDGWAARPLTPARRRSRLVHGMPCLACALPPLCYLPAGGSLGRPDSVEGRPVLPRFAYGRSPQFAVGAADML
jgi:hypothetical protein